MVRLFYSTSDSSIAKGTLVQSFKITPIIYIYIYIYIYLWKPGLSNWDIPQASLLDLVQFHTQETCWAAQLAGVVEYTNCISAEW